MNCGWAQGMAMGMTFTIGFKPNVKFWRVKQLPRGPRSANKPQPDKIMNSNKLAGKIALITGGSSGLGLATAKRFVSEGAYVFITGRRQPELDAAAKEIGSNVAAIRGDVANLADLDHLFPSIKEQKGRLDILFANAGGGAFEPLGQVTEANFDKYFGINVK